MIGKHAAVTQITIVRDGENLRAGFLFAHRHPFPQVARIGAAERRLRGIRLDQARLPAIVAKDHIPMEVVPLIVRGPFVADESGKFARLVRLIRRFNCFLPG